MCLNGPIQNYQQFSEGSEWAHSSHGQFSSHMRMGPFKDIGRFLKEVNGPIQVHRQVLSLKKLGQFVVIGIFLQAVMCIFFHFSWPNL